MLISICYKALLWDLSIALTFDTNEEHIKNPRTKFAVNLVNILGVVSIHVKKIKHLSWLYEG